MITSNCTEGDCIGKEGSGRGAGEEEQSREEVGGAVK